jgi:hypothetical protein
LVDDVVHSDVDGDDDVIVYGDADVIVYDDDDDDDNNDDDDYTLDSDVIYYFSF